MMLGAMRAFPLPRASALAILVVALASRAAAQSASDKAAAEALFDQGRAAMQEGDFAKACGLLERSQHIDPGVGTLLYLAECYEKSGRSASAWATFREAADAADRAKEPNRARTGRERAARLEPALSRLTIQVAAETQQIAGLSIERAGRSVQPALWNVPVPVDPSEYQITASAPGYETWTQSVIVPENAAKISVSVPALKKASEPDKTAGPPLASDAKKPDAPVAPQGSMAGPAGAAPDQAGKSQRTIALVAGGAGIIGVGLGTFFGLRAIGKNADAKTHCSRGYWCDDAEGPALAEDAKSAARISNVTFAVGGAALAGAAFLYFTSPRESSVNYAVGPTGVTVWGSFR
jgi:serine/threonine-protein kinase